MAKKRVYRTTAEKIDLVKRVKKLVEEGETVAAATESLGIYPSLYQMWASGRKLNPPGSMKLSDETNESSAKPRKKYKKRSTLQTIVVNPTSNENEIREIKMLMTLIQSRIERL